MKVLAANSGPDVNWLVDAFDLDLSLLARLGGHSMPRTHRGKERFPGMTITYAYFNFPTLLGHFNRQSFLGSKRFRRDSRIKLLIL